MNRNFLFWSFALFVLCNWAQAAKFRVVTEELDPYQIVKPDGAVGGMSTEVLKAVCKRLEMAPRIEVLPWARAYAIARSQPNVLIYSIAFTEERAPHFEWVGVLHTYHSIFYSASGDYRDNIKTLDDVKRFRVGVVRASYEHQKLVNNAFEVGKNLFLFPTPRDLIKKLMQNRVELVYSSAANMRAMLKKYGHPFTRVRPSYTAQEIRVELFFAFNRNSDEALVNKFRKAFEDVKASGEFADIKKKWATRMYK